MSYQFVRHTQQCPSSLYGDALCNCSIPHGTTPTGIYGDYAYGGPVCDCVYHNSRNYVQMPEKKKEGFAPALASRPPTPIGVVQPGMGFRQWHNWNMPVAIPNLPQTMSSEQLRYVYGSGFLSRTAAPY